MIKIWHGFILVSLIVVTGCAGRRADIVIDPAGVDMGLYQKDLAECQEISEQVRGKAVGGAVGGIVGNTRTAEKGAGVGAVTGMARGATATRQEKQLVIKNFLRNRGYMVLN